MYESHAFSVHYLLHKIRSQVKICKSKTPGCNRSCSSAGRIEQARMASCLVRFSKRCPLTLPFRIPSCYETSEGSFSAISKPIFSKRILVLIDQHYFFEIYRLCTRLLRSSLTIAPKWCQTCCNYSKCQYLL